MTGHGRGVAEQGSTRATIELRSVNHRFLDVKLRGAVPPAIEDLVAARVRERLHRGAVTVTVRVERTGSAGAVRVDRALAVELHASLSALAAELGLPPPSLRDIVAQPGVIVVDDPGTDDGEAAAAASRAVTAALDRLIAMRTTEGQALARELGERARAVAAIVEAIGREAALAPAAIRDRLHDRLARLLEPGLLDGPRLAQEIALLAERADVTEELVRAQSHLAQLEASLRGDGEVGRRLDFLTQELGREINTIGSKSTSAEIARLVVDAKAELEKIREQVQNLE
ncbi:MAG TPA: YicC/YloC family endoribonuclease [Kofleriaceae bacterium]|nr:YicC/YloC family endoribonuclease [Kofleriaceae bacterium]